jgi:hypothetical protein
MRVHDVAGKSPSVICIIKAFSSLLSTFMKNIAGLYQPHEGGMFNLECALLFGILIHDSSSKFE